jgi:hypothetical protein
VSGLPSNSLGGYPRPHSLPPPLVFEVGSSPLGYEGGWDWVPHPSPQLRDVLLFSSIEMGGQGIARLRRRHHRAMQLTMLPSWSSQGRMLLSRLCMILRSTKHLFILLFSLFIGFLSRDARGLKIAWQRERTNLLFLLI